MTVVLPEGVKHRLRLGMLVMLYTLGLSVVYCTNRGSTHDADLSCLCGEKLTRNTFENIRQDIRSSRNQ